MGLHHTLHPFHVFCSSPVFVVALLPWEVFALDLAAPPFTVQRRKQQPKPQKRSRRDQSMDDAVASSSRKQGLYFEGLNRKRAGGQFGPCRFR